MFNLGLFELMTKGYLRCPYTFTKVYILKGRVCFLTATPLAPTSVFGRENERINAGTTEIMVFYFIAFPVPLYV